MWYLGGTRGGVRVDGGGAAPAPTHATDTITHTNTTKLITMTRTHTKHKTRIITTQHEKTTRKTTQPSLDYLQPIKTRPRVE